MQQFQTVTLQRQACRHQARLHLRAGLLGQQVQIAEGGRHALGRVARGFHLRIVPGIIPI